MPVCILRITPGKTETASICTPVCRIERLNYSAIDQNKKLLPKKRDELSKHVVPP